MTIKDWIDYCLSKKGAQETYPFDATTLVFKVGDKMFGLVYDHKGEIGLNLKGDPHLNLVLRQEFKSVFPGYHMHKAHWNTVLINKDVPDAEIYRMIDLSYAIVYKSLTKAVKAQIEEQYE